MNFIEAFPKNFKDIFAKTWITYKKAFRYFIPLFLVTNIFFTIGFFFFSQKQVFTIFYLDSTKFILTKMSDVLAFLFLPFFLYQKKITAKELNNIFIKNYLVLTLLFATFLSVLQKFFLVSNLIFFLIGIVVSFYFLLIFGFLTIYQKNILAIFTQSFQIFRKSWKKIFLFFSAAFLATGIFRTFVELIFFYPDLLKVINQIQEGKNIDVLENVFQIIVTPKFYLVHNLVHFIYQPFLSIFLAILVYSLLIDEDQKQMKKYFQSFFERKK